jgi:hypothetical protein
MTPPTIAPALLEVGDVEVADAEDGLPDSDEDEAVVADEGEDEFKVEIGVVESVATAEGEISSVVVTGAAVVKTASKWSVTGDAPQAM